MNFLDVTINKSPQGISTDVYCKPTDTHQYLLSDSCHPKHCKEAIAYSQALRIRRICSTDTLYRKWSSELRQNLVSRGHSKRRVQLAINRALCTFRIALLATRVNKKTLLNRVPLVTTYHPRLSRLSSIVNDTMTILHSSGKLRSAIPEPPLIAFRRPRNLGDILVRARLPSTNSDLNVTDQESQGCSKCNRSRCKTCLYLKPAQKVKSHSTGLTYTIRTKSQCDTPNVIYRM